jgi:succinate dehydrogenase / fumarate reductase cytochrome b subunit
MPQAINPKGTRRYAAGTRAADWAADYLGSTVGNKVLVAVTGLSLSVFVLFHMIGNLKMFSGRESINAYAYFLKHDLGVLIWVARAGLLGTFLLHVFLTLRLKWKTNAARPIGYVRLSTAQASVQSRYMFSTGLVILLFTIFHLAHYTFCVIHPVTVDGAMHSYADLVYKGKHDVYSMVIFGFTTPWISVLYIVAQVILFLHLTHGLTSALQTLGLLGRRFTVAGRLAAYAFAGVVFAGNVAIVVAVWAGFLELPADVHAL